MHLKVPMGLWSTIQYAVGSYGKVLSKRFIKVIQWTCNDQAMKQKDTWQRKSAEQATIIINVPNTVNNQNTSQDHSGKNLITKSIFPMITCISCNFLRRKHPQAPGAKTGKRSLLLSKAMVRGFLYFNVLEYAWLRRRACSQLVWQTDAICVERNHKFRSWSIVECHAV